MHFSVKKRRLKITALRDALVTDLGEDGRE